LSGERLAKPLLAVTFDDGNKDNHSNARPILGQHHIHATFFVPVLAVQRHELLWHDRLGFALAALLSRDSYGPTRVSQILSEAGLKLAGKNDLVAQTVAKAKKLGHFAREELIETLAKLAPVPREASFAGPMTFKELADLVADGHEIGSHSMSHVLMTECGDQQLYYELSESKKILQQKLGVEVESFCYPNGDVDARTENAVGIAGYRRAVTTDWGSNDTSVDRFRLNRFDMDAAYCRFHAGNVLPALIAYRMSRTSRR
jgi:peptidoglycan/xylan/chitin deacetylase (PgdA/CDA1 family)